MLIDIILFSSPNLMKLIYITTLIQNLISFLTIHHTQQLNYTIHNNEPEQKSPSILYYKHTFKTDYTNILKKFQWCKKPKPSRTGRAVQMKLINNVRK
jgi:hypothetical protein